VAAVRAAKRAVAAALAPIRDATAHHTAPSVTYPEFAAAVRAFLE
jgi:hypothetical protein